MKIMKVKQQDGTIVSIPLGVGGVSGEVDAKDVKYATEGNFVHQEGFDGKLDEAIYDITNAIANNYGYSQEALYKANELNEGMASMSISYGNALWDEEHGVEPRVSELEAFLGYTDDDIIGLSANFENNIFTRLAGAKNLEAGEDFNKFPIYRDRVRCNVADNGTITAVCTPDSNPYTVLLDSEASFSKMGAPDEDDSCGGAWGSNLLVTPHAIQAGSPMRITVTNSTTNKTTIINSTLNSSIDTQISDYVFGTFTDSQERVVNLQGFVEAAYNADTFLYYTGGITLFTYPYCSDNLNIKIELLTNGYEILCDTQTVHFGKMGAEEADNSCGGSGHISFTNVPDAADLGKNLKIYIHNLITGEKSEYETTLGINLGEQGGPTLGYFHYGDEEFTLMGYPLGYKDSENSMGYYEEGFQLFVYNHYEYPLEITILIQKNAPYIEDGSNGQVMVYQPAFYYRVVPVKLEKQEDGIGYHIRKANYYISSTPKSGFKLHPAFYDKNGKPLRYLLYSAYESVLPCEGMNDADRLNSIVGSEIMPCGLMAPNAESYANVRGANWHIEDMQAVCANQLLMMLEYGKVNFQNDLASGIVTYAMTTGLTSSLGNASGISSETDVYGAPSISYRGMENPWGNCSRHVYGCHLERIELGKAIYKPFIDFKTERFGDLLGDEFCQFSVGTDITSEGYVSGYASAFGYGTEEYDWLLLPSELNGNNQYPFGAVINYYSHDSEEGQALSHVYGLEGNYFGAQHYPDVTGYGGATCRLIYLPVNTDNSSIIV